MQPGQHRPGSICSRSLKQASLVKGENKAAHLSLQRLHASLRLVAPQGPRRLLPFLCLTRLAASPCPVSRPCISVSEAVNHPHAISEGKEVSEPPGAVQKEGSPHKHAPSHHRPAASEAEKDWGW